MLKTDVRAGSQSVLDFDRGFLSRLHTFRAPRCGPRLGARCSGEASAHRTRIASWHGRQFEPTRVARTGIHGGTPEAHDQQTLLSPSAKLFPCLPLFDIHCKRTFNCTTFCIKCRMESRTQSSSSGTSKINSSCT